MKRSVVVIATPRPEVSRASRIVCPAESSRNLTWKSSVKPPVWVRAEARHVDRAGPFHFQNQALAGPGSVVLLGPKSFQQRAVDLVHAGDGFLGFGDEESAVVLDCWRSCFSISGICAP